MHARLFLLGTTLCVFLACTAPSVHAQPARQLDVAAIERVTGMKGVAQNGEYKVTVPQNGLHVVVDGFNIIPAMGLGSWAAFMPSGASVAVMGDVVVKENEIGPVEKVLTDHGLTVTGLHNHFVREEPHVMFMHIGGSGSEEELASGVKAVFDEIAELRGGNPSAAQAAAVENTLDTQQIAAILGHEGKANAGVYKVTISRPDVKLTAHGTPVDAFMGFNTWAAWQGTPEHAAVAGDFTMLEHEVAPVIKALVDHGIEVVAVHNHMVHEQPRIFFLHYWGVGPAENLAQGLRAALDQTGPAGQHSH
ncbi:MAG TPA: DUF1259 domain-containing protein [Rhodothermales bacterium]|nr:DUF1259 domain-containing protein [Rhodothermales bacterium]